MSFVHLSIRSDRILNAKALVKCRTFHPRSGLKSQTPLLTYAAIPHRLSLSAFM